MTTTRGAHKALRRFPVAAALSVAVAAALLQTGCASGSTSRFVRKPAGFINLGGPAQADVPAITPEAFERARREALVERASTRPAALPTIEGRDPGLRDALAALGKAPSAGAHLLVAAEYNRVGVYDQAYDHYSEALRLAPRNTTAFDGRARLLRDAGLIGLALADAHRARYFGPRSAEVRNTLGTILERQGLCRQALRQYEEAARLAPDAAWAQQNVARLTGSCS